MSPKRKIILASGLAGAGAALGLLLKQKQQAKSPLSLPLGEELRFPDEFLWGASTSSYQVEGGIRNDWSVSGLNAGRSMAHYTRYAEDFEHAKDMGHQAHRFSIEWARIQPRPDQWNQAEIEHYRKVLQALLQRGIKPFVTLWHFTQPAWFAQTGGWANQDNIQYYLAYVHKIVSELQDLVEHWVTLNEPLVYAFQAYDSGRWPPFGSSREQALNVSRNLLLAHARAYHLIHEISPNAQVGLVKNMTVMDPLNPLDPVSRQLCRLQDKLFNETIWQALACGHLDIRLPGIERIQINDPALLKGAIDFIGINYYTRFLVSATAKMHTRAESVKTDIGWEVYPEGLARVIALTDPYAKQLKIPIYITENGLADASDNLRPAYLVQHLRVLWQAIQAGANIKGYFHWSLLDNFEWADGYGYQFGLMDSDRQWRNSAKIYQQIIAQNGLSRQLIDGFNTTFF